MVDGANDRDAGIQPVRRIRTPDQRLRVFISSTLIELSDARVAVRRAVERLRLSPIMFELGARPHPPRDVYRAYLAQSDIFVGIYWQSYGWVAPEAEISGLEDELQLSVGMPRLLYVREPAPQRDPRLTHMLDAVLTGSTASVKTFTDSAELEALVVGDVALLLAERFSAPAVGETPDEQPGPVRADVLEPANPLIGRGDEVATICRWLESDDARLVTLTGPGGVGKSRLALEIAKLVRPHFRDGVSTVLLEALRDPALVIPTIARSALALTGGPQGAQNSLQTLRSHLANRRLLLVVDNFEHVIAAAPDVAALLEACPGLTLLVTSRAALRVRAERELAIFPLAVPDRDAQVSGTDLEDFAAVALFVARATATNPRFTPNEDDLRAVAEICRRLDGLPLAIELAAARVRLLPPARLLERLQQRFDLLTGGTADMPDRHQTLRATIDWGHDLLEPPEQIALRRLAAFAGGWTLAAAEAVLTGAGPLGADILDVLDGLVTKSFVKRPEGEGPTPRFGMLETIRDYAAEHLEQAGEVEATVDAHARYFLEFAEHAATQLQGPDQSTWFAALEADHDNLRAALRRLEASGDIERRLRLTTALGRLWLVHAHVHDARRWVGSALEHSQGRADALRADLLTWGGWLRLFIEGDTDAAEKISQEALGIRRALGDAHGEAMEILALGNVAAFRGDAELAQRYYEETARLAETGDEEMRGRALSNLGVVARAAGDPDTAVERFREVLEIMTARGDEHSVMLAVLGLAGAELDRGNLAEATRLAIDAVRRCIDVGDESALVEALEDRAAAWALEGRREHAAWLWGAAEAIADSLSATRSVLEAPLYTRYLDAARTRARESGGTDRFVSAWRAGAESDISTAVAVALGQRQPGGAD